MIIGGLDIGTTGCKLVVYNEEGEFLSRFYREYDASRVNGEHEIDAMTVLSAVYTVIKDTARTYKELAAIGVTTFGESFVLLDEKDQPLHSVMLYTDPRGKEQTKRLIAALGEDALIRISGTKPHQMYSLPKIMWIKDNCPAIYKKAKRILLMEDYIIYMLTGAAQIDYSLAARTMAFDIRSKCWSDEIFAAADIDQTLMSKPVPAGTPAGPLCPKAKEMLGFDGDVVIVNGAHDQVAAAVGAGVFEEGQAVDGTGTVECITPVFDTIPNNTQLYYEGYSVVPYVFDGAYVCYALSFTGGAVLKWYRDNFAKYESELAAKNAESVYETLNRKIKDTPTDILVLPYFAGAATPYMDSHARAVIAGLTLEHTNYDIYKALMEGVTYEMMLNIEHLERFGINPKWLFATGGGAASDEWLQIKADILGRSVTGLDAEEAGACGTCMLLAAALGLCKNLYEARALFVKERKTFEPNRKNTAIYKEKFTKYKKLYPIMREILGEE